LLMLLQFSVLCTFMNYFNVSCCLVEYTCMTTYLWYFMYLKFYFKSCICFSVGTRALTPGLMRPRRVADNSPPCSANEWSYTSTPQCFFMAWCLIKEWVHLHVRVLKHRDDLSYLRLNLPTGLSLPSSLTIILYAFLITPFVLHAQHISYSLIWPL
jgi:hypothetical protein